MHCRLRFVSCEKHFLYAALDDRYAPLFTARVCGTRTDMSAPANAFEAPPKVELTKDQAKGTSK